MVWVHSNYELYLLFFNTHWIRVALITAYGVLAFWLSVRTFIRDEREQRELKLGKIV